jgi:CspA family cold shock protein
MPTQLETDTCQRCGRGFVLTTSYLDLLERRGFKVVKPVLCPTCFVGNGPQPKERGAVKWFSSHKHYGFIVVEGGEEAFFHQQQFVDERFQELHEGRAVCFHLHYAIKGPEALNVELL